MSNVQEPERTMGRSPGKNEGRLRSGAHTARAVLALDIALAHHKSEMGPPLPQVDMGCRHGK